jgi:hypothetical protein
LASRGKFPVLHIGDSTGLNRTCRMPLEEFEAMVEEAKAEASDPAFKVGLHILDIRWMEMLTEGSRRLVSY